MIPRAVWLLGPCVLGPLARGQVPARPLQRDAALPRPFTHITGLLELRDGRVVLVDAGDELIALVDFARGTAVQLGHKGSGPREYRFPTRVMRLGGDSLGIEDGGNKRMLVITGQGKLGGLLSPEGLPTGTRAPPRENYPVGDGQGRLFTLGMSPYVTEATYPDSAPIERWRVGVGSRDTVAWVPLPPWDVKVREPGTGTKAFTASPEFAVGPEGQIGIVRPNPYSVEIIDARGKRVRGQTIRYQRVRVSEELKRQWREEQERPVPVSIMTPKGDVSAGLKKIRVDEPVHWPAYLPPFLDPPRFGPDGLLWIHRTVAAGAPEQFDLVDGRGILVRQVTVPPRSRLAGFGKGHVYMVRLDEDDQEILERYRLQNP